MKLFSFVRRARWPSAAADPVAVAPEDAAAPAVAVAPASAEKRWRRPSSSGSASWKPTLVAISEDAVLTAARAEKAKAKPAALAKAKAKPAAPAKAKARPRPPRADYDDFRRFGAPTVLPAFAPTAFLF